MPVKDCRSCKFMVQIKGDRATCRHYEIRNGLIHDEVYERPFGKCPRYKERTANAIHLEGRKAQGGRQPTMLVF